MASALVEQAWESLATAIQGITTANGYGVNIGTSRFREVVLERYEAAPSPLVCLYDVDVPTTVPPTVSRLEKRPVYSVLIYVRDQEAVRARQTCWAVQQAVEQAVYADVTQGGIAIDTRMVDQGLQVGQSGTQTVAVATMGIEVWLRHDRGDP